MEPVRHSEALYRGDRFRFRVDTTARAIFGWRHKPEELVQALNLASSCDCPAVRLLSLGCRVDQDAERRASTGNQETCRQDRATVGTRADVGLCSPPPRGLQDTLRTPISPVPA